MSVYKDELRNTWFCEFRYKGFDGKSKKTKKRGFKTKREAKEYENNFLATVKLKAEKIPFKNLTEIYLKDIENRVKVSTFIKKEKILKLRILPFFENFLIGDITPMTIREWQNRELKNNYKKSYFLTIQKELSTVLNYAVKFYNLQENPLSRAGTVTSSPLLQEKKEINVWSIEEFNNFIKNVENRQMYVLFNLLFYTGARIGEVLALGIKDINFKTNTLRINKTYQKINGKEYITAPKTKASNRIIKLPTFLIEIIKNYIESLYDKNTSRLFITSRTNIHRYKNEIVKKYGLENIRLHDFRHSHASILLNQGVDIVTVSKRLGHESIKMTLDTYSHLIKGSEDKLIGVLDKLKGKNLKSDWSFKMTRQEIYNKIQKMLKIEKDILLKRYESQNLNYEEYKELLNKRIQEYREWEEELMLTTDNELTKKLSFIIDTDLEKF